MTGRVKLAARLRPMPGSWSRGRLRIRRSPLERDQKIEESVVGYVSNRATGSYCDAPEAGERAPSPTEPNAQARKLDSQYSRALDSIATVRSWSERAGAVVGSLHHGEVSP